ncbi:TetR family transcriptional regulator [Rouxiella silvae]|uniref:TetR family transcriptional regulator n=1 Tax=Rouxiella silvae TaxID=1646373 RepID=A0AA40X573_9GAMM|nr:TetR/AcrR family transcriptional regulator [Rouxiella silvae]KQN48233.1 TetR family transcriptional regulator [Serratia sp. Leaf50]MBF6638447.1 TetR/AcrR family transcriptional regulator [Rouxiella silvae]ORJ20162.1 TetR family transcriptional regulator [Rouxiella silvae]
MNSKKSETTLLQQDQLPEESTNFPRRPGRPRGVAKGAERRALLLETALAMFARRGIADTPLTAIAREAGVTPAMLHYYFNSREQLLDVLIEERFMPIRASFSNLFQDSTHDPVAAITQLAEQFIAISVEHAWFAPLWVREIMSESGLLKQRMDQRYGDNRRNESLRCIARWQDEGKLNADLSPELIIFTLFGLTFFPIASSHASNSAPGKRVDTTQLAKHVVALLRGGLGPQPANK